MTQVFDIILKNVLDDNNFFVFPTEIAADLWLEKYITEVLEKNLPYPKAVAKERFLSWDKFKTSSIKSTRQDKDIIPSIVRKVFAVHLIEKNKNLVKANEPPLFNEIISTEHVDYSQSFANWITKVLPQLALWKKKFYSRKTREEATPIEEDYFVLYDEYASFLEKNNLFDSAWETPPFADEGKTYFIFFPESLSDFEEYKEILSSSNHINLLTLEKLGISSDSEKKPKAKFFDNSAQELHHLILYIKDAYENQGIPYEKMAISLTDSEEFLPYIERELEKYGIPYTTRIGKSMGKYLAGRLFASIKSCYQNNFSFAAIQNLLTNESLFWKYPGLNQGLINFGIKNNCFCGYEEDKKIQYPFEKAFEDVDSDNKIKKYYTYLQDSIIRIYHSKSFKELVSNYWKFKTGFLEDIKENDAENPLSDNQKETNDIMGRVVSELAVLLSLEEDNNFYGLTLPSCFDFFVDYITEKEYLAKPKNQGIGIYPYRVAAAAPFDLHIIPNATQNKLAVKFPRLSFMPKNLKNHFEITDSDVTSTYIQMYIKSSQKSHFFSASTFSYSGYSIIHSLLDEEKMDTINPYNVYDIVKTEKDFWQKNADIKLEKITENQKSFFNRWKITSENLILPTIEQNLETQELIEKFFINDNKIVISATSMRSFYECPKKLLLSKILKIYNEREEAMLSSLDTGKILHEALELYFKSYEKKEIESFVDLENGEEVISSLLDKIVDDYKSTFINKKILECQKTEIKNALINFLKVFTENYKGYKVYKTEYSLTEKLDIEDVLPLSNFPMEIYLTGKIDLVLSKGDELFIIDYKTKKTPNISECLIGKSGEDPKDFQLAFYTYLLEKTKENVQVTQAGFISINDMKESIIYGLKKNTRENFQNTLDRIKEMTFSFAKKIYNKNLCSGNERNNVNCSDCTYKKTCRPFYSVSGRNKFTGEEK